MKLEKHFVTFLSPGTFMAEGSTLPIDSWDVRKAQEMAVEITERYNATPYGFYFTTRSRGDADFDSKEIQRSHTYYLPHCKIETLAEVKRRNDPNERILICNMEGNGWKKIVTTTTGWKWTQPFNDGDEVLAPIGKGKE